MTIRDFSKLTSKAALAAALLLGAASESDAQSCACDCNGDGTVTIAELIRAVNISLGAQPIDNCLSADGNNSGTVAINELIRCVNASLGGCPDPVETPTFTSTRTPTNTPTPTATIGADCGNGITDAGEECDDGTHCVSGDSGTLGDSCTTNDECSSETAEGSCERRSGDGCQENCMLPACGDGFVDNQPGTCAGDTCEGPNSFAGMSCEGDPDCSGETCDDGNNEEGATDSCPGNCRIATCVPSGNTLTVNVDMDATPDDLIITGLQLFVRYPEDRVRIPGSSNAPSVQDRVDSATFPSITLNDRDYGLVMVLFDPSFFGAEEGNVATIEFDLCEGAPAPTSGAFSCSVDTASDDTIPVPMDVTSQVSCSLGF